MQIWNMSLKESPKADGQGVELVSSLQKQKQKVAYAIKKADNVDT